MRMVCNEYGIDYLFDENFVTELLIESPHLFLSFVTKLWNQYYGEEDFVIFSESDKELHIDKVAEIISDPFQVDINNRKILTKIYQDIIRESQENHLEQMMSLQLMTERFLLEVCEHSVYPLTYELNPDFTDLLKLYRVHVDDTEMDLVSRLISYVKLTHSVLNKSIFIFLNLKAFFSDDILRNLYQTLCYEKVYILLVERYDMDGLEQEKRIIIDKDACVILDELI